jgi:hypothetical protein
MNALQNTKFVNIVPPEAIKDNTAWTDIEDIDTNGWDYLTIVWQQGATDVITAALAVADSDDGTTYTNFAVVGTTATIAGTTSALPPATPANQLHVFEIDLRKRKRYIQVDATAGNGSTGTFASCLGILSRGTEVIQTAAARGAVQIIRV